MTDFVPCDVDARYLPNGRLRPRNLTWNGVRRVVVEIGRTWQEGSAQHMLVQVTGQITLELKFDGTWSGRLVSKPRFSSI